MRDIHRTRLWLQGHPVWVGSDTFGGWFATGPLYYGLILPVVAIWGSAKAVAVYTLVLNALSYFAASFLLGRLSRFPQIFFLALLLSLQFPMSSGLWINNAAFIVILMPWACWLLWRLHSAPGRQAPILMFGLGLLSHVHVAFLAFVPLGAALALPAKFHWKQTLLRLSALLGAGLLPLLPFALTLLNDRYGRPLDGPYFHSLNGKTGSYFLDSYLYIVEHAKLSEWSTISSRIRVEIGGALILSLVAVGKILFFNGSPPAKKCAAWLLAVLILLMPYILQGHNFRYSLLWFLPAIYAGLFSLVDRINGRQLLLNIIAVALSGTVGAASLLFFKNSLAKPKAGSTLTFADMDLICEYFNDKLVAFNQFAGNVYELTSNLSESSVFYSEYCFRKKTEEPKTAPQYLAVERLHATIRDLPRLIQVLPEEVRALYPPEGMKKIFETPNMIFYQSPTDSAGSEVRRTHTHLQYQLDAAVSVSYFLREWKDAKDFFNGQYPQLVEARLCSEPFFCSLYILWSFQEGELKAAIVSRVLQTKYVPPMVGAVENFRLKVKCDGQDTSIPLASLIGVKDPDHWQKPSATFFTPLWLKKRLSCQSVELTYLEGDRFYLNGVQSELPARFEINGQ